MAKLSELAAILGDVSASLNTVSDQLVKATDEILSAVSDTDLPPDVETKLAGLKALATTLKTESQKLDDLNPDKPTP